MTPEEIKAACHRGLRNCFICPDLACCDNELTGAQVTGLMEESEAAATLIMMLRVLLAKNAKDSDAHRLAWMWDTDRRAAVAEFFPDVTDSAR